MQFVQTDGSEFRSLAEWSRFREASGLIRRMHVAPHILLNNPVTARSVKWKLRVLFAAGRLHVYSSGPRPVSAIPSFNPCRVTPAYLFSTCSINSNFPRNHSSSLPYGCLGPDENDGAGATDAKLFGVGWPGSCQTAMILHLWSSGLYAPLSAIRTLKDYGEIIVIETIGLGEVSQSI